MPKYLILLVLFSSLRECIGEVLIGTRAQEGQFPWLIQYHTILPCGGVLVSPDWLLTAAQCVQQRRHSLTFYATGLNGTGSSQIVGLKATFIFEEFKSDAKPRDHDRNIALVKLKPAFDMCDDKVRLLDIAPVRLDNDYKSCLIFGWEGTVSYDRKVRAKPIQYSKVLLNSWRFCMYTHEGNTSYKNVFCTMVEDKNGIKACAGNPGSPVVCEDQYQRMTLLGIASWSEFALDCGGLPTYLETSVFGSWMRDTISLDKNSERGVTGSSDNRRGACQRERRTGSLYDESDIHQKVDNYSKIAIHPSKWQISRKDEDEMEDSREPSAGRSESSLKNSTNVVSNGRGKIKKLRSKLEPPVFDEINDYTNVIGPEGSHFDIARERDEKLSQYREIGQNHRDEYDEPTAVSSQQEKHVVNAGKLRNVFVEPEHEIFDDSELIIEDFDRSAAPPCIVYYKVLLLSFYNTLNTIIL